VLAAWLARVEWTGASLGVEGLDVAGLFARITARRTALGRALDDYIEAQVHGPIDLGRDVAALVVAPAFEGTDTGAFVRQLSARYGFPVRHHAGFVVDPSDSPDDVRGPRMRPLAERIGEGREGRRAPFALATVFEPPPPR